MRQLSFNDRLGGQRGRSVKPAAKTKRATPARRRTPQRSPWRRRAPWIGAIALGLGIVIAGGVWLAQPGRIGGMQASLWSAVASAGADAGLTVQTIFSEGRNFTPRAELLAALDVKEGTPILAFDPAAARERLLSIKWIEEATVERRLPRTIFVHVSERKPLALWQQGGEIVLVDTKGVTLQTTQLNAFAHLPLIVGDAAPDAAPDLLAAMAGSPRLQHRIVAAVRVAKRRWNLRFDSGLEVLLPEGDVAPSWARLVDIVERRRLLESSIHILDLRLDDRAVLRGPSGEDAEAQGEDT